MRTTIYWMLANSTICLIAIIVFGILGKNDQAIGTAVACASFVITGAVLSVWND